MFWLSYKENKFSKTNSYLEAWIPKPILIYFPMHVDRTSMEMAILYFNPF